MVDVWLTDCFVFFRTLLRLLRRSLTRNTTRRGIASWAATSALTWRTRRVTSSTSTSARSPSSCSRAARRYIPLALNFVLLAAAVLSGLQSRPPPEVSGPAARRRRSRPSREGPVLAWGQGPPGREMPLPEGRLLRGPRGRGRHSKCIYGVSECVNAAGSSGTSLFTRMIRDAGHFRVALHYLVPDALDVCLYCVSYTLRFDMTW